MSRAIDMEKFLMYDKNLIAAETLCNEIGNTKEKILEEKLLPLLEKFAKSKELILDFDVSFSKRFSGFFFARSSWNKKYNIGFEFQKKDYKNLVFGIHLIDGNEPSATKKEQELLHKQFSDLKKDKTKWWPWWSSFDDDEYNNWSSELFIRIYNNPKEISEIIIKTTSEILEKIDNLTS